MSYPLPAALSLNPRSPPFTPLHSCSEESLKYEPTCRDSHSLRQPSKQEWKEWKADIRNWYLVEKKTQRELSKLLYDKHGFRPTGKQLTKRLDDWEFKKNKARRRSDLIEKHTIFAQQREHFNTQRISSGGESRLFQQTEFTQFVEGVAKGNDWMQGTTSNTNTFATFNTPILGQPCTDNSGLAKNGFDERTITNHSQASWKDGLLNCHSWDSILAKLARQFADMNVIFSVEMLHTQKNEDVPVTNPPQIYLASDDIKKLTDSKIQSSQRVLSHHHTSSNLPLNDCPHQSGNESFLKFPDMDVDFPSSRLISSLSMELYPFPASSVPKPCSRTTPTVNVIRMVLSDQFDKYERLRLTVPNKHPAMIRIMAELRRNYMELEKWYEAELWLRREFSARQLSGESVFSSEYLSAQLNLINVVMAQGRYEESRALHSVIHQSILDTKDTRPDTSLFEDSLETIAWLLRDQGYIKDSGKYFLDLLQVRLNYLGPRHTKTIHAMRQIGCNFRLQKRYQESEKLTTITVQLLKEVSSISRKHLLNATSELSNIRFAQGHLEESAALDRELITNSETLLGEEHPDTLMCMLNLAASLTNETRLEESEELVRRTLTRRVKTLGEENLNTLESMKALGHILRDKGCYEEASEWFEKSFRGRLAYLGSYHMRTIWVCDSLAECYRAYGRPDKALLLLERFIEDIEQEVSHRGKEGFGDEMRSEILPWIDHFKKNC